MLLHPVAALQVWRQPVLLCTISILAAEQIHQCKKEKFEAKL